MQTVRYDRSEFKATLTSEGYLVDSPIVGRTGIQVYQNADGTVRYELRPEEEVFADESLVTFSGKPITDNHPQEPVSAKNAKKLTVGFIKGDARRDGSNIVAPITIFDHEVIDKVLRGGKRELSLGYKVDLEETPGEWNGQKYDAIQRNIRINHLAIVPKGRAGNARLNLDRSDAVQFNQEDEDPEMANETLARLRLDTGIEYAAAQEVVVAYGQLKTRNDELQKQFDVLSAERDTLKSEVAKVDKIKADAVVAARAEVAARAALEKVAVEFKVDFAGKTDREVKEAIVKTARADADLTNKSEDYLNAAFDLTVSGRSTAKQDSAIATQRAAVGTQQGGASKQDAASEGTYQNFMRNLGKKAE